MLVFLFFLQLLGWQIGLCIFSLSQLKMKIFVAMNFHWSIVVTWHKKYRCTVISYLFSKESVIIVSIFLYPNVCLEKYLTVAKLIAAKNTMMKNIDFYTPVRGIEKV